MATTVHLPPELITEVDRRARALGISRNRYIRHALETVLREETTWSRRFTQELERAAGDPVLRRTVDEMMRAIAARRSRKKPPAL